MQEIFADPTPVRGLPASEFIELRNRSANPINLRNWTLRAGKNTGRIPVSFTLLPDSLVILCTASAAPAFQTAGPTVIVSGFPSLDNDGDTLVLSDASGTVLHALYWDKSWYGNTLKEEGGWSLEMKDIRFPCAGTINWSASNDPKGGTPGKKPNLQALNNPPETPRLLYGFLSNNSLLLHFNAPVKATNTAVGSNSGLLPGQITEQPPLFSSLQIAIGQSPDSTTRYTFNISGIQSCDGRQSPDTLLQTGLLLEAAPGELILNEILFNPPPGGSDYIELYNKSNRVLNAGSIYLANRASNGGIANSTPLSKTPWPLGPAQYLAISPDTAWINQRFQPPDPTRIIKASLPSFPDDQGYALLLTTQGTILDELPYREHWHAPLISNREGISLERLDPFKPTNQPDNWYSAAGTAGFGTPGYRNSQHLTPKEDNRYFFLSSKILTPDQDGRDDILLLAYQFPAPGSIISVRIFDESGRPVRHLANAILGGRAGQFRWEGTDEKGQIVQRGFYVVQAEAFHPDGSIYRFREAVAVYKK
jgi:hypothetical protein